jgi:hypothetical protein
MVLGKKKKVDQGQQKILRSRNLRFKERRKKWISVNERCEEAEIYRLRKGKQSGSKTTIERRKQN